MTIEHHLIGFRGEVHLIEVFEGFWVILEDGF